MVTINLFRMSQERSQSPQSFQEQFIAMRQVCDQLGLCSGQSEQGEWAILKKESMTDPSDKQFEDSKNKVSEEYHTIRLLYLADQQHHGNVLEDMENVMLKKKDLSQRK